MIMEKSKIILFYLVASIIFSVTLSFANAKGRVTTSSDNDKTQMYTLPYYQSPINPSTSSDAYPPTSSTGTSTYTKEMTIYPNQNLT